MRKCNISLNLTQQWAVPGRSNGVKVELATRRLPGGLLIALRSIPAQYRFKWDGPYAKDAPELRVVWGWPLADDWVPCALYPSSHLRTMKMTVVGKRLREQTGHDTMTTGRWVGELVCEPDEQAPRLISLTAWPRTYIPREPEARPVALADHTRPIPRIELP